MRKSPSAATRKRAASKLGETGGRKRQRRSAPVESSPEAAGFTPADEHVETSDHETDESAE